MAGSVSLPDLIKAIRGQIPADKCDLLEDLVQKLQKREVRLNRQEFLHKVRDIAGEDAPALRHALKQLAVDRSPSAPPGTSPQLGNGFHLPSTELSPADLAVSNEAGGSSAMPNGEGAEGGLGVSLLSSCPVAALGTVPTLSVGDVDLSVPAAACAACDASAPSGAVVSDVAVKQEVVKSEAPAEIGAAGPSCAPSGAMCAPDLAAAVAAGGTASVAGSSIPGGAMPHTGMPGTGVVGGFAGPAAPAGPCGQACAPCGVPGLPGSQASGVPPGVPGGAPGGAAPAPGAAASAGQQQRLEVAAAAVLVHAASCKNAACPVPHCNKMKKIHSHFLECNTVECPICKKLKPLTYIHAKHCVAAPGEQCVIPYCARAKRELQVLMQQRQMQSGQQRTMCGCGMPGMMGAAGASASGIGTLFGCQGSGASGPLAPNGIGGLADPATVHQHAHYLLVLAHVMKCTNHECAVPECKPTKDLVTNHTRSCRQGDACLFPRCALSKKLMRHHRECPDQACAICLPLRRRLAAAKMGAVASAPPQQQIRRKPTKRKKGEEEEEEDGHAGTEGGAKRKRKMDTANGTGGRGGGGSKKGRHSAHVAVETQEVQMTAEHDVLESGFSVSVHFPTGRRGTAEEGRGEWRPGVVMRAYTSSHDDEPVYDIMMLSGVEEKVVSHNRCRMVCGGCLTDKRVFKPPPMFCEKCFTAIHQRWSYWEEEGDEGGVKLCKRCYADIRGDPHPDKKLAELVQAGAGAGMVGRGQNVSSIDRFIEKKEKDRPEYVDNWVQCDECHAWLHWTCALYKGEDTPDDCLFFCEECRETRAKMLPKELVIPTAGELPETQLSEILQKNLASELKEQGITCAPVTVRVVSNIETSSKIEEIGSAVSAQKGSAAAKNQKEFPYRSKCILAFQRVQGHEICFFAMYVQEYGSDCPEPNTNRVYISYLDSVRYFESSPDGQRTFVYHSMLINYLGYAKELGYQFGHIWVSPPKQGDDYIFYAHPEVMLNKRMGLLKLKEWYEKMLEVAKEKKVIFNFQDMVEEYKDMESAADIPIFSGDHWAASITSKIVELNKKQSEANAGKKKEKVSVQERKTEASTKAGGGSGSAAAAAVGSAAAGSSSAKGAGAGSSSSGGVMSADKQDEAILNQINEEMRSMRNHFIVVTLTEQKKGQKPGVIVDPVPLMSNEFVDTRSAFLEKCQMYHWQFDELRNAQHSTLMLLYYLHGMYKEARKRMAETKALEAGRSGPSATASSSNTHSAAVAAAEAQRTRSSRIEMAMHDWTQLLNHANEAALKETWQLPPEELFQRILVQINRSKRDILQDKYNQCKDPACPLQTRSVFIRVLKRIAESFMSCLLSMSTKR